MKNSKIIFLRYLVGGAFVLLAFTILIVMKFDFEIKFTQEEENDYTELHQSVFYGSKYENFLNVAINISVDENGQRQSAEVRLISVINQDSQFVHGDVEKYSISMAEKNLEYITKDFEDGRFEVVLKFFAINEGIPKDITAKEIFVMEVSEIEKIENTVLSKSETVCIFWINEKGELEFFSEELHENYGDIGEV